MGAPTDQEIEELRRRRKQARDARAAGTAVLPTAAPVVPLEAPQVEPDRSWLESGLHRLGSDAARAYRDLETGTRLLGLGVGTGAGFTPLESLRGPNLIPFMGDDWIPTATPGKIWDAFGAFQDAGGFRGGDVNAAISAYQDALGGGPGYWGTAEAIGGVGLTGGPAALGTAVMKAAPRVAPRIARVLAGPSTRPALAGTLETGIGRAGQVLRAPWELEEAAGRLAARGLGVAAAPALRTGRRFVQRVRGPGAAGQVPDAVGEGLPGLPAEEAPGAPGAASVVDDVGVGLFDDVIEDVGPVPIAASDEFPLRPFLSSVYKGPQPGVSNLERRAQQKAVARALREGYRELLRLGVAVDPRLAAQEARMAKPIARGKKALVDRIDFEVRLGRFDPEMGRLANRWFAMLPDKYLDDLGSSYVQRIQHPLSDFPGQDVLGVYTPPRIQGPPSPGIITIAPKLLRASGMKWDRTIIHEVAHHLEDFVSPEDARNLVRQWQRDVRSKGRRLVAKIDEMRSNKPQDRWGRREQLTEAELALIDSSYRYEGGFGEWFAEVLTDKALRDLYMEVPVYRNIIQKVTAQIEVLGRAARDFIAEAFGRGDVAERAYKKLISGDYSVAERRSLYSDVRFRAIGNKLDPVAAVPTPPAARPGALAAAPTPAAPGAPAVRATAAGGLPPIEGPPIAPPPIGPAGPLPAGAGGVPPKKLRELQSMDRAITIATRSDLGRTLANLPVIRNIQKRFNPSAVRNTVEGRGLTGLAILKFEARQKSGLRFAALGRLGTQEKVLGKVDNAGLFVEGRLKGLSPNDVRTNWEQPYISQRLTDEQKQWIRAAQDIEEEKLAFLKANGIEVNELTFEEGGHYAGRRVMGKFDREGNLEDWRYIGTGIKGRKLAQEQQRSFKTQQEAIAAGYRYIPEDEALLINVRAAYDRVAKKKFAEWLIDNSPALRVLGKGQKLREGEVALAKNPYDVINNLAPDLKRVVFKGPEADATVKLLREELNPSIESLDKLLSATAKINAVGRLMVLNGDASQFLIQLMYMTGARGGVKAWGKGIEGFVRALADPRYHSTMMDNNRALLDRHRGIITSLDGNEMTEAVDKGGLFAMGPKYAPWRLYGKALDPFARAFNAAMDTAAIQLVKSMDQSIKPKTAAQYADIDAFINEIRGLASSARLGQSGRWRAVETNLLLAPRYNRAVAALLWDTVANGGLRGNEARRALGRSLTGIMALAAGLSIAEYHRNTENPTWKGTGEAILAHIDPTRPTFFAWKVGNTNLGPGTKLRSLVKLFGDSKNDPRSLLEIGMGNPFTRFGRANLAPIGSTAWDIFSGHTYMGDPTGFFDGWTEESVGKDFSKLAMNVIAPDIMPIWVQSVLLEGGTLGERVLRGGAEFGGARAYPLSRPQLAEEMAREQGYGDYESLSFSKKAAIDNLVTERHGERAYTGSRGPLYKKKDKVDEQFLGKLQEISDDFLDTSKPTEFSFAEARKAIHKEKELRRIKLYGLWDIDKQRYAGGIYEELYDMDEEQEEPEEGTIDHVLWQYRGIIPKVTNKYGDVDWDEYDKLASDFWSDLDEGQVDEVLENIRVIEGEYPEAVQTVVDAGRYAGGLKVNIATRQGPKLISYWDIEKLPEVRQEIAQLAGANIADVNKYMDTFSGRRQELAGQSDVFSRIKKVLLESRDRKTGRIGAMKKAFIQTAPEEWTYAMLAASYNILGEAEKLKIALSPGVTDVIMGVDYATFYRNTLRTRAQGVAVGAR